MNNIHFSLALAFIGLGGFQDCCIQTNLRLWKSALLFFVNGFCHARLKRS